MYSDISAQFSPGWTCIITICKKTMDWHKALILTLVYVCVCICMHLCGVGSTLSLPLGLSQGCVNSDPMVLGGTIQCQEKGQLSLLSSIRSEKNTEREGKSRLKWWGPGEYVSNRPSSGCVSICVQHVHRRDHDPLLPFSCSPQWAEQACKVTTELNGAERGTI